MAGRLIDRTYILERTLGEGGMGVVYKAMQRLSGRSVALKLVQFRAPASKPPNADADIERRMALAREFQTLSSLHHPNIIQVLDYGFDDEAGPYYTMEMLPAFQNLAEAASGRTVADKMRLLTQVLWALAYIHRRGIIHRDLKPSNVLCHADQVKLVDFGLATVAYGSAHVAGTLEYIAPELWFGAPPSAESDLYALGIMMCELLTGSHPFPVQTEALLAMLLMSTSSQTCLPQLSALTEMSSLRQQIPRRTTAWAGRRTWEQLSAAAGLEAKLEALAETTLLPYEEDDRAHEAVAARPLVLSGINGPLGEVVRKLLAIKPTERFHSAADVLNALSDALGERLPVETAQTRESFLQASGLIGRSAELGQLTAALEQCFQGQGSNWLIGGESGIGKSRLLAELRTLALVRNACVVQGEAVTESGGSYQVWMPILRGLCLRAEGLGDDHAAVLKELIPELPGLLERPLADAPKLPPEATQSRLLEAIAALVRCQQHPTVLLLEDLQWAGADSLALFRYLGTLAEHLPLLIIGSFRDDEAPRLPENLPHMRLLRLERLDREHVAELSSSMLGGPSKRADLVDYLYRQTEGNIFFLIEVMRTLAEQAGRIDLIHQMVLPENVFTGGIERIAQRRVDRVPPADRAWLDLVAVLGRQLDLTVLRTMLPGEHLEQWLMTCANAAVLEIQGGTWRFAHDKLREAILSSMPPQRRRHLHRQAAHTLEQVYKATGLETRSAVLAYHFQEAGELERAVQYRLLAGDVSARLCSYRDARQNYATALSVLEQLPSTEETRRLKVDVLLRQVYTTLVADSPEQNFKRMAMAKALLDDIAQGRKLSSEDMLRLARVNYLIGRVHFYRGETHEALGYYRQVLPMAGESGDAELLALPSCLIGTALLVQGHIFEAEPLLAQSIGPLEQLGEPFEWFRAVGYHGVSLIALGRYREGLAELERVVARARTIAQPSLLSATYLMAGSSNIFSGDWPRLLAYMRRVLEFASQTGDKLHLSLAWSYIGWASSCLGLHEQARSSRDKGRAIAREMGGRLMLSDWFDAGDAEIALNAGQNDAAFQQARDVAAYAKAGDLPFTEGVAERVWGEVLARRGKFAEANAHMNRSIDALERGGMLLQAARSRLQWALQQRARGEWQMAQRLYAKVLDQFERSGCQYALEEAVRRWERAPASSQHPPGEFILVEGEKSLEDSSHT